VNTALVPVASAKSETPAIGNGRPRADFLAQLIATLGQAPQTRVRRRAEPEDAIAAYGASDRVVIPAGHALTRSL
jgi:hypothetical protein